MDNKEPDFFEDIIVPVAESMIRFMLVFVTMAMIAKFIGLL